MPSTYAHFKLGQEIKEMVPPDEKKVIEEYPELFLIGLHGPDILFYYRPLTSNKVNRIGYGMHERAGKEFFEKAAAVAKAHGGDEAYLSYIYGFICHFALDVTCHGYIDEKIKESGVSHAEIEVEFDRQLMVEDGLDPIHQKLTGHIKATEVNAFIIKDFFESVTDSRVKKALKGMIFNNKLLLAPSRFKRRIVYALLKLTGNYKEMHGLIVNYEKNPDCTDSTERLKSLYYVARNRAVTLIEEYADYMENSTPLNQLYEYTFGTKLPENGDDRDEV